MLQKRETLGLYYVAMLFSCIGMSLSFVRVKIALNFLQLSVLSIVIFFIISIVRSKGRLQRQSFIFIMLAAIAVSQIIIKLIFYGNFFLTGPLLAIACFLVIISLLFYSDYRFCFVIYFLINVFGVIMLSVGMFIYSNDLWGVVTIGAINPQTLGAWALIYAIGALLSFDYYIYRANHKFLLMIIEIFIIVLMMYFSWITEARFSILLISALVIFRFLPIINIFNKKILRALLAFSSTILMFFFKIIYLFRGESLLNGRERIWSYYWDEVLLSPVFGVGYNSIDANTFYSHNMFVDYFVLFGVLVAIIFQVCLSYVLIKKVPSFSRYPVNGCTSSRLKYDAFISFLIILIAASVEGCLFSIGAGGIFLFSFSPLLIALSDSK